MVKKTLLTRKIRALWDKATQTTLGEWAEEGSRKPGMGEGLPAPELEKPRVRGGTRRSQPGSHSVILLMKTKQPFIRNNTGNSGPGHKGTAKIS